MFPRVFQSRLSTLSTALVGIIAIPTSVTAWRKRPVADLGESSVWHDGSHESTSSRSRIRVPVPHTKTLENRRHVYYDEDHELWSKIGNIRHKGSTTHFLGTEDETLMERYSRLVIMSLVTVGSKFLMHILNKMEVIGNKKNYDFMMESILSRDPDVPLITVANHTSMLDDPGLMGALVGFKPVVQNKHRWGVCTQEICFQNDFTAAFTGAGRVLPIKRGEGVDQALMSHLAYKVARKEWLHVFPEAHVAQTGSLGRGQLANSRPDSKADEIGVLKWGVGKLIAHSPTPPLVIPFYHVGMHQILPMFNREDNNHMVKPFWVFTGNRITVRVGRPIDFSDIFAEYEQKHGKVRKMKLEVGHRTTNGRVFDTLLNFGSSTAEERELYSALTKRVEESLLELERESKNEIAECEWGENARVAGKGTMRHFR